jgi:hypothetical protein
LQAVTAVRTTSERKTCLRAALHLGKKNAHTNKFIRSTKLNKYNFYVADVLVR